MLRLLHWASKMHIWLRLEKSGIWFSEFKKKSKSYWNGCSILNNSFPPAFPVQLRVWQHNVTEQPSRLTGTMHPPPPSPHFLLNKVGYKHHNVQWRFKLVGKWEQSSSIYLSFLDQKILLTLQNVISVKHRSALTRKRETAQHHSK